MVKLTLILSGRTLARHEFKEDFDRLRIGRNADCDVTVDNLGISRYHCEILSRGEFMQLVDLRSGNGTFVNGAKVDTHNLNTGDMISLGKFTLQFERDAVEPDVPLEDMQTHFDLDEQKREGGLMTLQVDAQKLAKKHRQQATRNRGYLRFESGRDLVLEKSLFKFGRESTSDIQLSGWFCPRVVAILIRDESGFRLVNVSPSGTSVYVNGIRKRDTWLNDNDHVAIRNVKMHFHRGLPVGRSA